MAGCIISIAFFFYEIGIFCLDSIIFKYICEYVKFIFLKQSPII